MFNKHFTKVAALTSSVGENYIVYIIGKKWSLLSNICVISKILIHIENVKTYKIHMLYSTLNF